MSFFRCISGDLVHYGMRSWGDRAVFVKTTVNDFAVFCGGVSMVLSTTAIPVFQHGPSGRRALSRPPGCSRRGLGVVCQ